MTKLIFIKILLMLVKPIIRIGKFLGFEWFLILMIVGNNLEKLNLTKTVTNEIEMIILLICVGFQILQICLNIYHYFKDERPRNALVFLISRFIKKIREKKQNIKSEE